MTDPQPGFIGRQSPQQPIQPFDTWLNERRRDLEDEYREDNDDMFVYSEFVQWARLEYDKEVYHIQLRNRR